MLSERQKKNERDSGGMHSGLPQSHSTLVMTSLQRICHFRLPLSFYAPHIQSEEVH